MPASSTPGDVPSCKVPGCNEGDAGPASAVGVLPLPGHDLNGRAVWLLVCGPHMQQLADKALGSPYHLVRSRQSQPHFDSQDDLIRYVTDQLIDARSQDCPADSFRFRAEQLVDVIANAVEAGGLIAHLRGYLAEAATEIADEYPGLARRYREAAALTSMEAMEDRDPHAARTG